MSIGTDFVWFTAGRATAFIRWFALQELDQILPPLRVPPPENPDLGHSLRGLFPARDDHLAQPQDVPPTTVLASSGERGQGAALPLDAGHPSTSAASRP